MAYQYVDGARGGRLKMWCEGVEVEADARTIAGVERIPYEPARRFGASFYPEAGGWRVFVKGAAERVLPMCNHDQVSEGVFAGERLAREGFRVLVVASGVVSEPALGALRDLTLLGIAGIVDPLRPEAAAAVAECRSAGLSVAMITGDHPLTALAIARQLGIAEIGRAHV